MNYELSSSQKMFITNTFDTMWNHGIICTFKQNYNYEQLNKAINSLVKTFESLRLCFKEEAGICLNDFKQQNYPYFDFSKKEDLSLFVKDFINKPFSKENNLSRFAVFRLQGISGLVLCAHHLSVDGFSGGVAAKYINEYLKNIVSDKTIRKSYEEHVLEEHNYKKTKRYLVDKNFWSKQFLTNPVCSIFSNAKIPFGYSSKEINFAITSELFSKIKVFCNSNNISLQSYFNTVYSVYISRKYGLESFTIGTPVLNRTSLVDFNSGGLYMHIVPLLVGFSDDSFLQNALDIEDAQMTLYRHQKFTQYDIKEMLKEQGTPISSLFDIVCDYQEFEKNDDYEFEFVYSNSLSVPLEIHLQSFGENEHNLKIRYRTAYFSESDVQEMLDSFMNIMEYAVDNADELVTKIPLYSKENIEKVMEFSHGLDFSYPISDNTTLYSLFEEQANTNEEKVCIKANDEEITFKDFKAYAERIDSKVREYTKNEKSVIGVICERSFEMYGAVYGIIRGGNAYLPIDPNYPQDRIDYILSNSNAKAVITQSKFCHLARKTPCIDATSLFSSKEQPTRTEILARPEDTAYVIYTSGSTGNPKGAKVSHKSAVNRILWMHDKYPLQENDVILQKTPYTFDVSVWELFWWGMTGRTLCASKPDEHFLPAKILEETEKNKVTHLHFVPSVFDIFITYLENNPNEREKFNTVKYVFLSGEALSASLVTRFYKLFDYNKVSLHNLYGPTECAVDVTYYDCVPTDIDPVPIGKPIYNTQLYVVDKYLNPTPIGVVGELCIAGVNVGQGYLNNEQLTNEKFIDNPFGEGKLYKTGDLAYWREDGEIIFCGRIDSQVKLNGQRIELGEIESVLQIIDGIERAVVVVRKDKEDGQLICAFYTGKEIDARELRSLLGAKLPRYMVPHIFTHLEDMPMTSSGKISRKELPEIDLDNISTDTEYVAPQTEEEKSLAEAIKAVLDCEEVSMLDNFFNIGGDSISAIYIVSELEEMGYELHVADIMQNDTLSDVAKAMKSTSDKATYDQNEVNGFIPFSPIMRAFLKENNTIPKDFVHTCIVSADCDEDTARKALDVLTSHHDILRGTFVDNGIRIHPSSEREVYSFKAITVADTDKAKEYLNKTRIDENQLVNVVFCNTEKENLVSITIHHFLIDLVSWEVLMEDFKTVVKQLKNNEKISLPAKTASFKLWSDELQKYSETMPEGNKEYWKKINNALDNAKSLCSHEENEAEEFSFTFDKNISDKLINEANTAYGTRTNEILLTALGLAASKIADGSVGIMVESHGRTELNKPIAIERTVGWFTSCYPIVINNNDNVAEELINTKETLRRIPKNGIEYLLLSEGFHKNSDIIFNFYQNGMSDENSENKLVAFNSDTSVFPGKINVNCLITDNILTVNISVPKCKHKPQISEELGLEFVTQIEKLVDICTATDTVIKTRSDFSDDELTESELDELKDLFDWTDDDE